MKHKTDMPHVENGTAAAAEIKHNSLFFCGGFNLIQTVLFSQCSTERITAVTIRELSWQLTHSLMYVYCTVFRVYVSDFFPQSSRQGSLVFFIASIRTVV